MGETADQIKQQIDEQREQLGSNLQQLETKVKETVDWKTQFESRPMAGIGLAFGAGFLLSVLMPSGGSSSGSKSSYSYDSSNYRINDESSSYQPSYAAGSYGSASQPSQPSKPKSPEMNEISETVENIRGAVMGLAATRLRSFLAEAVPGFQDEYEQARTKRGASDMSKIDTQLSSTSTGSSSGSSSMSSSSPTSQSAQDSGNTGLSDSSMTGGSTPTFGATSSSASTARP